MRFIPERHRMVAGLVGELGLPVAELAPSPPPGDDGGDNLAFVRGRLLRVRELADPGKVPYRLAPAEHGLSPEQLRDRLRLRFGPSCGHAGPREFEAPVLGRALYTRGFWDLVSQVHSTEARQLMLDCFPEVANGTAALALRPNDLAASIHAQTIAGGFDRLPKALADLFVGDGGELFRNHRLLGIHRCPGQPYVLRFVRTATVEGATVDLDPIDDVEVRAVRVILALPRRALELVRWDPLRGDRRLGALIRSGGLRRAQESERALGSGRVHRGDARIRRFHTRQLLVGAAGAARLPAQGLAVFLNRARFAEALDVVGIDPDREARHMPEPEPRISPGVGLDLRREQPQPAGQSPQHAAGLVAERLVDASQVERGDRLGEERGVVGGGGEGGVQFGGATADEAGPFEVRLDQVGGEGGDCSLPLWERGRG